MDASQNKSNIGYDPKTRIYHSLVHLQGKHTIPTNPNLDTATFVLSQFPSLIQTKVALIDSSTNQRLTYSQLQKSIHSLAAGLYHKFGVRKGDVIFLLSSNSIIYPTICLSILLIGGVLTTSNPINTESEITKQVLDSGAKLAIAAPDAIHKLISTKIRTIVTTRVNTNDQVSIEELIDYSEETQCPENKLTQSDTAAILYSSGTTGISKGVVLTHGNLISTITLLNWAAEISSAKNDIFLCFIPMFHIYGLVFFGLGLLAAGTTTVLMNRFELTSMLQAIQVYKVNNIPAVPPVILAMVKHKHNGGTSTEKTYDLSSLKSVGSGAAPLSKEVANRFREKFPWVELKPGYGLTESCGAAAFFVSSEEAKNRSAASGGLFPSFSAKVVDLETGAAQPPYKEGELWLKGPTVMKGYLGNESATSESIVLDGWLRTGDLCYFDEDGYIFVVDRIKELIKHKGYQVAPAELESILLNHPDILDAAVIPLEDEDAGEVPMAYVVRATDSKLSEEHVIQFVASQVAPYKKIKRVAFINEIPKSAAGKILRKDLRAQSKKTNIQSKL